MRSPCAEPQRMSVLVLWVQCTIPMAHASFGKLCMWTSTFYEIMAAGLNKIKRAQRIPGLFLNRPAIPTACYMIRFTAWWRCAEQLHLPSASERSMNPDRGSKLRWHSCQKRNLEGSRLLWCQWFRSVHCWNCWSSIHLRMGQGKRSHVRSSTSRRGKCNLSSTWTTPVPAELSAEVTVVPRIWDFNLVKISRSH